VRKTVDAELRRLALLSLLALQATGLEHFLHTIRSMVGMVYDLASIIKIERVSSHISKHSLRTTWFRGFLIKAASPDTSNP